MRTPSRSGNRGGASQLATAPNEIFINASAGETRVAVLERGVFVELHIERASERNVAGTVVLGRVTRVLPGMQAAFVDIGLDKAGFLYVGDYFGDASTLDLDLDLDDAEPTPRPRRGRRNGRPGRNGNGRAGMPKIENLLREGQEIVVQVAKEPIGTKGARITSHVSIAGRHLVLTPWSQRVGVSRRIESDRERRRVRDIVSELRPPDLGFIIRTAGEGASEADIEADVRYLTAVWDDIQIHKEQVSAPYTLYSELSLPLRVIRDFANSATQRIAIDDAAVYAEMKDFLDRFVADPKPRLERYQESRPIFDAFGIESAIDDNLGKKVWLKSGGHLIVDQAEALTAIDVNTGRYVGKRDLEETVLKTNLEAVQEVVHQLRFRNLGGLIIIDLIDMETFENREKVYRALQEALRQDKAKTNILKISELGLVEMTRKRTRENLVQQLCEPCRYCEGRGYMLSAESVAHKVLREIRKDLPRFCGRQIAVAVSPSVAEVLLGRARQACTALGEELGREIEVRARPGMHQEQFEVTALDRGPAVDIPLRWLEETAARPEEPGAAAEEGEPPSTEADEEPGEVAQARKAAPEPAEEKPEPPEAEESPAAGSRRSLPDEPEEETDEESRAAQRVAKALADAAPRRDRELVDGEEENLILPRFDDREGS